MKRKPSPPTHRSQIGSLGSTLSVLLVACQVSAVAAIRDSFDSPEPSWSVRQVDCPLQMDQHRRTFSEAHTGSGCEYFQYSAGAGTQILLAHPIEPARVIDELVPSLWMKSTRSGLQLSVRVVLPRTKDPRTGQPYTALLPGGSYGTPEAWQQLFVENLPLLLSRQVRLLRSKKGPDIDDAEAYIDMVVVNAYAGIGATRLWLDDLEVAGHAAPQVSAALVSTGEATVSGPAASGHLRPMDRAVEQTSPVTVRGPLMYVHGVPFFARAIEGRGERLARLAELGFNVVYLSNPPTHDQVSEANRLDLWLVAPAPPELAGQAEDPKFARVLCWPVGERLAGHDAISVSRQISELRQAAPALRRPVLSHVLRDVGRFASLADVVLLERAPIHSSFELQDCSQWWRQRGSLVRPARPFWAAVQSEITTAHREQIRGFSPDTASAEDVEPEQIWLQAFHAVAGGARGILFRSQSRLDGQDVASRRRAAALQVVNQFLVILDPWLAAGTASEPIHLHTPGFQAALLSTDRSRLLIVLRATADQQYLVAPDPEPAPLSLPIPGQLLSDQAYRITAADLQPLRSARGPAGNLRLEDPGLISLLVLTDDPLAVGHLRRRSAQARELLVRSRRQIAGWQLEETQQVLRALIQQQQATPEAEFSLRHVESQLARGQQLLDSGDLVHADRFIAEASDELRRVRKQYWHRAAMDFPTPNSSPLCTSFRTLPAHWELARQMNGSAWGPNEMAAGDFEQLEHLLRAGWTQHRGADAAVQAKVELSLESPRTGRSALRLLSWSNEPMSYVEDWPVWVKSAPVPVRPGQMIRINGWAKVPSPVAGSADGLLIFDSMSGIELATRIQATRGWQQFTLYRVAPSGGEMTVVIALTGVGTALIDDLEVSLLR